MHIVTQFLIGRNKRVSAAFTERNKITHAQGNDRHCRNLFELHGNILHTIIPGEVTV